MKRLSRCGATAAQAAEALRALANTGVTAKQATENLKRNLKNINRVKK